MNKSTFKYHFFSSKKFPERWRLQFWQPCWNLFTNSLEMFRPEAVTVRQNFVLWKISLKTALRSHKLQFRQPWLKTFLKGRKLFRPMHKNICITKKLLNKTVLIYLVPAIREIWKLCPNLFARSPESFWSTMENIFESKKFWKQFASLKVFLSIRGVLFWKSGAKKTSLKVQNLFRLRSKNEDILYSFKRNPISIKSFLDT